MKVAYGRHASRWLLCIALVAIQLVSVNAAVTPVSPSSRSKRISSGTIDDLRPLLLARAEAAAAVSGGSASAMSTGTTSSKTNGTCSWNSTIGSTQTTPLVITIGLTVGTFGGIIIAGFTFFQVGKNSKNGYAGGGGGFY